MALKLKLWGIRGSLPAPHTPEQINEKIFKALSLYRESLAANVSPEEFVKTLPPEIAGGFGGHTSCVQVLSPTTSIIIDAGSGLRPLSEHLAKASSQTSSQIVHLFLTHFHWDHLIGLPFFSPLYNPSSEVHFYAVQEDMEAQIRLMFQKPRFPVPFEALGAKIHFHQLKPRQPKVIGDISLTPYKLDHPDPCWGYRVECNNRVYAHCVDSECTRLSRNEMGPDLSLYQGIDVMLFDAQYTFLESMEKINWGHSTAPIGLDLAIRENVRRVLFVHHDPGASDSQISLAEQQTRDYYKSMIESLRKLEKPIPQLEWSFAREGMLIEV